MSSHLTRILTLLVLPVLLALTPAAQGKGGGRGKLPPPATDADFHQASPEKVELGRLLFYDKILSGNGNISCATCHHSLTDTGDGLSLSVGEGGRGLGVTRDTGSPRTLVPERVPRNAPHVFNVGAKEVRVMFHDGRVEEDPTHPSGFSTPAGDDLPPGLESVSAAQAMFPVTSGTEMAGQPGENAIADAASNGILSGPGGVWDQLADRLRRNREYVRRFRAAYPREIFRPSDITFVHAANAIAAFEGEAWRATGSPFDRYLEGEKGALSWKERKGLKLFYGKARCADCHSGTFLSDQDFHAVAMPQIGPGKGDGRFGYEDFGRERVTGKRADRYCFRTPALRNVALTGPWGHAGAYDTLEAAVRHMCDPVSGLLTYDQTQAVLPPDPRLDPLDFLCVNDPQVTRALLRRNELRPIRMTDDEVELLVEFLNALTDPASIDLRDDVPQSVPSGLTLRE